MIRRDYFNLSVMNYDILLKKKITLKLICFTFIQEYSLKQTNALIYIFRWRARDDD